MDGKLGTFLLGVIAAAVLFLLWKDQNRGGMAFQFPGLPSVPPDMSPVGCSSCAGSSLGTAASYAAPGVQAALESTGTSGMIGPPGVPLNSPAGGQGATSFYTNAGVTPDTTFTFFVVPRNTNPLAVGSPLQPGGLQGNVPGSPTTLSAVTPVRATQQVPPYSVGGFQQRYNILGVPLSVLQSKGYLV